MTSPLKSKETAIAQRQKIYETIEHLEKSGEVKKWQKNFLRGNNIPFERYFGQQRDGDKPEKSQEKPPEK
jgi:hypothetical protein